MEQLDVSEKLQVESEKYIDKLSCTLCEHLFITGRYKVAKDRSEKIIDICCEYFKVTHFDLCSKSRKHNITFNRQLLIYFLHKNTILSTIIIGKMLNRDHATVLHSCKAINDYMFYPAYKSIIEDLDSIINTQLKSI